MTAGCCTSSITHMFKGKKIVKSKRQRGDESTPYYLETSHHGDASNSTYNSSASGLLRQIPDHRWTERWDTNKGWNPSWCKPRAEASAMSLRPWHHSPNLDKMAFRHQRRRAWGCWGERGNSTCLHVLTDHTESLVLRSRLCAIASKGTEEMTLVPIAWKPEWHQGKVEGGIKQSPGGGTCACWERLPWKGGCGARGGKVPLGEAGWETTGRTMSSGTPEALLLCRLT